MKEEIEKKGKADLVDQHVGKRLKMRRMMLGLSQQDLGAAVNVSIQQIQKYEKATNRISSGKLHAFARLLMVPIDFFFKTSEESSGAAFALADSRDEFAANANLPEKEVATLIKFYGEIEDADVRKKIVDLVKAVSSNTVNLGGMGLETK